LRADPTCVALASGDLAVYVAASAAGSQSADDETPLGDTREHSRWQRH
jgi:hypothetical protein